MELKYIENGMVRALIEEVPDIGFYLYIYEQKTGRCIADHLQDKLEIAIKQAFDKYGIDRSRWEEG